MIATFGDIRGFGTWEYRAATPPEVKEPFILRFYETMEAYVKKHTDMHFKYVGDGFLVIRQFSEKDRRNGSVYEHLNGLRLLTKRCIKDLDSVDYPSLRGFRIRHFDGHAYKLRVIDPNDPERKRLTDEFVGYVVNAARRILDVNPEILCLATQGITKTFKKRRDIFKTRPLGAPSFYPKSVNKEDIDTLQVLKW